MDAVIVLSKYQIVIPKEIRESVGIVSGQKIQMIAYRNRIELIPIKPIFQMRGFSKGIDTEVNREGDRV
jgi:AbrB family looped-hinge helix DNA binding protein